MEGQINLQLIDFKYTLKTFVPSNIRCRSRLVTVVEKWTLENNRKDKAQQQKQRVIWKAKLIVLHADY